MCAIFGYGPTVVSREKGGTDTLTAGMNGYIYRITFMAAAPPSGSSYQGTLDIRLASSEVTGTCCMRQGREKCHLGSFDQCDVVSSNV